MKKLIIHVLMLAFVAIFATACTQTSTKGPDPAAPVVEVKAEVIPEMEGITILTYSQVKAAYTGKTKITESTTFKHWKNGRMTGTAGNGRTVNAKWKVYDDGLVDEGRYNYYVGIDAEGNYYKVDPSGKMRGQFKLVD